MASPKMKILNSKGEEVVLNAYEQKAAEHGQKIANALGLEVNISTLTALQKLTVEQKFFEVQPSLYVPLQVGVGKWATQLTTYRTFYGGSDFESGFVDQGANDLRTASANVEVDSITVPVHNWVKTASHSLIELNQLGANSFNAISSIVTERAAAIKKNWDLGVQKIAFIGSQQLANTMGLLNQVGVTTDATLITKPIGSMTGDELKAFSGKIIAMYRANCNYTAYPDRFVIPESDYNTLTTTASPQFPIKSVLQLLEETFKAITQNDGFKILPLAYADADRSGLTVNKYVLYKYDVKSLRMDIPIDFASTLMATVNGFHYNTAFYGQLTGVMAYRPLEMMYFTSPKPAAPAAPTTP